MDIAIYTLKAVAYALVEPTLVIILVILSFILYVQNKKTTVMQKMIIGERLASPLELTVSQLVLGIFGGAIGSVILSYCGIIFDKNSGIEFIFLISVALLIWHPRFVCFSYSGAILGLASLLINDISKLFYGKAVGGAVINIDITSLMTLVGVLHIVEGLLVMIDGEKGSIPVFTNRDNKIIGGFALKRYWPIPIAVFIMVNGNMLAGGQMLSTPDWWPLIKSPYSVEMFKNAVITLAPFYAVLGYSSITFTKDKAEKAVLSGTGIVLYGIILSFVAQLAYSGLSWKLFVLLFAPTAHEIMIRVQRYLEINSKPKYISEDDGIMVLEVAPGSPANEMGIKSGDKLLKVNDKIIATETDILDAISGPINYIWFKIKRSNGKEDEVNYTNLSQNKKLGLVFVPKGIPKDSMIVKYEEGKFKEILDKLKTKDNQDNNNDTE